MQTRVRILDLGELAYGCPVGERARVNIGTVTREQVQRPRQELLVLWFTLSKYET